MLRVRLADRGQDDSAYPITVQSGGTTKIQTGCHVIASPFDLVADLPFATPRIPRTRVTIGVGRCAA